MPQSTQEFLDSLSPDLNPEERAEELKAFSIKQEEEYKKLQAASQKWVDTLADKILEETKNIDKDPNYLQELYKKDPKTAEAWVKHHGWEYSIEDLKAGKQLPSKTDDFNQKMTAYEMKKESDKLKNDFISSLGFSETEVTVFTEKLTALTGDRTLWKEELKQAMVGVAFSMGKKLSSNKETIVLEHNAIPTGWSKWWNSDEYKPNDPNTMSFLESQWVITVKPQK